jgi:WD40 repeat protein
MVAVASQQEDNSLIEIYDPSNDFEKTTTVYTFHTSKITALSEHKKMLLSGSEDCSIGIWDIQNNF